MGELEGLDLFGADASRRLTYDAKQVEALAVVGQRIADFAEREDQAGLVLFVAKYIERALGVAPAAEIVRQKTSQVLQHLDLMARFADAVKTSAGGYDDHSLLRRKALERARDDPDYAGTITQFYRTVSSKFNSQK